MNEQVFLYSKFFTLEEEEYFDSLPAYLKKNLNPNLALRPYQEQAFQRFIYYLEKYKKKELPTHLFYNMATGSGKTLIMAGLILYLYQRDYRNFLFFVDNKNIIEKTKQNFLNLKSSKYLFAPSIEFDSKKVSIREVNNFDGASTKTINICFTTIHQLHTDLVVEKENAMTFDSFKDKKIVLLADEAHHFQAKTKKQKELIKDKKPSWENTVLSILQKNEENILLEFSATLDYNNSAITEKYKNKIIYRYDLIEFRR